MPSLRNLERRLLGVERRLTRPVETEIPVTLLRAALDQMDDADRERLSEFKGLTREQIRCRIANDYEIRTFARRAFIALNSARVSKLERARSAENSDSHVKAIGRP